MALSDYPLWRAPLHHEDLDDPHDEVHWVELFYDLIHVVCVFMLGNYLSHHLSLEGLLIVAGVFTVIWMAWAEASYFSSLYVSTDVYHRCIMFAQVCTVMLMAASIPDIAGEGAFYFGVAYACNRGLTALLYRRVTWRKAGAHQVSREMSRNFGIAALCFLLAAYLPSPWNYCLFGVVILLIQISFFHPKFGVIRLKRFTPRISHFSERFALLFLIVMGEGFFKLVISLSEEGVANVSSDVLIKFILSGMTISALTWAYFDYVGQGRPRTDNKRHRMRWWYGHLVLMFSALMIGVALKAEVQVGFSDHYPFKYAALACSGFVLFSISLAVIQSSIEHHAGHRFYTRDVQLFGIGMAILTLCAVPFAPAWVGNMLFGTAVLSQIAIPMIRAVGVIKDKGEL